MHEYSVIGHSRASIGRHIGTVAALLASLAALLLTLAFGVAERVGLSEGTSRVVVFPLNAAAFYFIGHLAFEKWIWKRKFIQALLGIPNLNGEWNCEGETKDEKGNVTYPWKATITITQSWEKIWVYLNTGQSSSRSRSASLIKEPGRGYVLMFSYQNEPRIGEPELKTHVGYCELTLDEALQTAEGDYFNNKGHITFGRMKLTKKENKNG